VNIRNATADDIPFILEMEQSCPTAAHWSEIEYRSAIERVGAGPERLVLLAEGDSDSAASGDPKVKIPALSRRNVSRQGCGILLGFLVARHVSDEWELENIVVAAHARRKGIGAALMKSLLDHARRTAGKQVLLEVRESNQAARKLYEAAGFRESGRRKLYYSNPDEDAILYSQDVA
jgi:ribosomal-protein-alanine N-acetyltransferase